MLTRKLKTIACLIAGALALAAILGPGPAAAQGPGSIPVPSVSGGIPGSPGMAGTATLAMPSAPVPPAPPSISPPSGGISANLPSGGIRDQLGSGGLPALGQDVQAWGSSFAPFAQDASGQWSRFGQRGSASLPITRPAEGAWFAAGGFGAPVQSAGSLDPASMTSMVESWRPDGALPDIPPAPAAFDDITGVTQAAASQQAQQAYDQFWLDYYAAVDLTAQDYYDAATATAEIMLDTYYQAVLYTLQSIDYYLAYYDQYAAYCAYYPWDCAMYAYDVASATYYYVGDLSDEPVGTVEIGEVETQAPPLSPAFVPEPSAEAYKAVVLFANDQLGAVVDPLYAGVATDDVLVIMQQLFPHEIRVFLSNSMAVSCTDYWGLLSGGLAGVGVADCSATFQTITLDTLAVEMSKSSIGAYSLLVDEALPVTPAEALALITTIYPALDGLAFAQVTDIAQGMAFTATTAGLGTDPMTGVTLSVPKVIYAGVIEREGKPYVYALVGVGQPYVDLIAAGNVPEG